MTVSNIVVPKEHKDHLTSMTNSYITKNYNLPGAVQIIRVDTNTGNANGGLHGSTTTVTVSNGYTYTQVNPNTCSKGADVVYANSNCSEYECPSYLYVKLTDNGICTTEQYNFNMLVHCAPWQIDGPPRPHSCINGKWKCTYQYDCAENFMLFEYKEESAPEHYKILSTENCSGPGVCDVATQNCFEYESCSPNGSSWYASHTECCSYFAEWEGDFLATCKTPVTYSCPNANQKLVGSSCYSCSRGTLNASNSCDYDCTTTSDYWQYDITIHYYVIK